MKLTPETRFVDVPRAQTTPRLRTAVCTAFPDKFDTVTLADIAGRSASDFLSIRNCRYATLEFLQKLLSEAGLTMLEHQFKPTHIGRHRQSTAKFAGLTTEEFAFNCRVDMACRRLRRTLEPLREYGIYARFDAQVRALAAKLREHKFKPRSK